MNINKIFKNALISIFIVWLTIVICLYFVQDNLIFAPQVLTKEAASTINTQFGDCEDVAFTTPDNIKLHGWFVKNSELPKTPLIIYFGGNAEEVSNFLQYKDNLKGWSILAVNYRGYGLSEGKPNETNIFKDAVFIYDNFLKRSDIDASKIVTIGRSLGSGVAVHLAYERNLAGVILVTPYDSITRVAQEKYPIVPVSLLMKNRFNSIKVAPKIHTPMLALAGEIDSFIPYKHAIKLVQKWGGQNEIKVIKNAGHNNIQLDNGYWKNINDFLKNL